MYLNIVVPTNYTWFSTGNISIIIVIFVIIRQLILPNKLSSDFLNTIFEKYWKIVNFEGIVFTSLTVTYEYNV